MDQQTINLVAGAAMAALGWFARMLWERQDAHGKELAEFKVKVATEYVTDVSLTRVMDSVLTELRYIRDRLDGTPQRRHEDHPN